MGVCVWFLLKFNMILTQSQLRKKQVHENGKAQPNEQSYLNILTITYISLYIRRERERESFYCAGLHNLKSAAFVLTLISL